MDPAPGPHFELPEWAGRVVQAAGVGGLVAGVVGLTRSMMDRFWPSADRRSRERVDMRELDIRRIRELEISNRSLAQRLEEAEGASDRYRDLYFAEREERVKLRGELVQTGTQLELLRMRLGEIELVDDVDRQ